MIFIVLFLTVMLSHGNPIDNTTEIVQIESTTIISCDSNLVSNLSLAKLLNNNRIWFVLGRTNSIYGEQTWTNVLMQTSTKTNQSNYFQFIGENSNGSCVHSESGEIGIDSIPNRIAIRWSNQDEGFLETIFADENFIQLNLCYSIDLNQTNFCALNRSEQFVIGDNPDENNTISWLKSPCSTINPSDFIVHKNPNKCLPSVLRGENNDTMIFTTTTSGEEEEEEMVTVTPFTPFEFTTRTHRTNRLEILEEYYNNASANRTNENRIEETTTMEMKAIVVMVLPDNQTNVTVIEDSVSDVNETSEGENPVILLHKAIVAETTTDVFIEHSDATESVSDLSVSTMFSESINSTEAISNTSSIPTNHSVSSPSPTTEQITVDQSTVSSTIFFDSTTSEEISETTTTEVTTSTSVIPVDCPPLKDCPFDVCTFARKLDHRGCPTCNCLFYSDKSNVTCPALACQACLYGHYTDSNGCSICRCQIRPYPPMGERCPQLNCNPCYFGTVKDEYNCDTCICIRPNSQECPMLNCTFGSCKYGSMRDEDNCSTCECLRPMENKNGTIVCPTLQPCTPCHLGYVKDADGCQTCQCKQRGSVSCPPLPEECQCEFGFYLNSHGCETCSCLPDPKNASRQACWELANQANAPSCTPDGLFSARQCDHSRSMCWCVTPSGLRISQFESKPDENVNCACASELYQVSSLRMIGHHLLCLINGNYDPIQCDSRYCSCVNENGKTIGPSISIQNREQLRCVGVYQQLHPERFLLRKATMEQSDPAHLSHVIASSLCLSHLEQVRNTTIIDDHMLIPVCDVNGLYASVQCDQNERYCWCVDKKTGVEMEGTRRLNARPNCNID